MQIREFQPGWIFRNGTTASWYCLCNGIKFDPKKWPGLKGNIKIIHDPAGQLDGALAASPIQDMDHPTAWLILLDSYPTWLWHSQFAMVITMALIEIDGLPFLIAWWFSMAMLVITRGYLSINNASLFNHFHGFITRQLPGAPTERGIWIKTAKTIIKDQKAASWRRKKVVSLPEKCPAIAPISVHSTWVFTAKVQKSTWRLASHVTWELPGQVPSHLDVIPCPAPVENHRTLALEERSTKAIPRRAENGSQIGDKIAAPWFFCACLMESGTFLWLLGSHVIDLRCCQPWNVSDPFYVVPSTAAGGAIEKMDRDGISHYSKVWSVSNIQTIF